MLTLSFQIKYDTVFGGAIGFTRTQFQLINGFSNVYWGWGGEDDDIYRRLKHFGFNRTRPEGKIGLYNVIGHKLAKKNKYR